MGAFSAHLRAADEGEGGAGCSVIFDFRFVLEISRLWFRAQSLPEDSLPVKHSFVCSLGLLDDRKQFITLNLAQSHDDPGKHPGRVGQMSIGGSRQYVLGGAQNHLDGLRSVGEGRGVRVPPPPNLDPLQQRKSLRHILKSLGAPS